MDAGVAGNAMANVTRVVQVPNTGSRFAVTGCMKKVRGGRGTYRRRQAGNERAREEGQRFALGWHQSVWAEEIRSR